METLGFIHGEARIGAEPVQRSVRDTIATVEKTLPRPHLPRAEGGRFIRSKSCPPDYQDCISGRNGAILEHAHQLRNSTAHHGSSPASKEQVNRSLQALSDRVERLLQMTQPLSPASSIRTALSGDVSCEPTSMDRSIKGGFTVRSVSVPASVCHSLLQPGNITSRANTAPPCLFDKAQYMDDGITMVAGGGQPNGSDQQGNINSACGSSFGYNTTALGQKRRNDYDDDNHQPTNGEGPSLKRRKGTSNESSKGEGRFPCIFYAGEPDRYPTDDKKYEHISQML